MADDIARLGMEIDTSELVDGIKTLKEFEEEAERTDKAVEGLSDEFIKLKKATDPAFKKTLELSKAHKTLKKDFDRGKISTKQFEAELNRLNNKLKSTALASKSASKGMINVKQVAGQAGFQIADFSQQIAGGQNAMLAFGQQSSQLAGAFGPFGAIAGGVLAVGSAIGVALIPQLKSGKLSSKELEGQIISLSDSFKDLGEAERIFLAREKNKAIDEQREKIDELGDSTIKLTENLKLAEAGQLKVGGRRAQPSLQAERAREYSDELITLNAQLEHENDILGELEIQLNKILDPETEELEITKEREKSLSRLVKGLKEETETHGFSNRQLALRKANLLGAGEAELLLINNSFNLIEGWEEEAKALKRAAIEQKELTKLRQADEKLTNRIQANQEALLERDEAARVKDVNSLIKALNKELTNDIWAEREVRLELLNEFNESELAQLGGLEAARLNIIQSAADQVKSIKDKAHQEDLQRNLQVFDSSVNLTASLGNLILQDQQRRSKGEDEQAKKSFETAKSLQRGIAIMSGGAAIVHSLSDPTLIGPAKWLDVAATTATVATQLAAINSTSFGGGGAAPSAQAPAIANTDNSIANNITINASGSEGSAQAVAQAVAGSIKDLMGDGLVLFDRSTEQAAVLR